MFDKTIDGKPTIVDSTGMVIKDLTVPIYKRTNQFQLNYTIKMTTLEQQMRPDLISISEYGTDKHTEDILKLNGITNPFSMDTAQIIMVFDEKDIENLSKTDSQSKLLEPYERLQDPRYINNDPNPTGTGYVNSPVDELSGGPDQSLLNLMNRSNTTPDLKNRLPLIDPKKPYSKFEVDPITKKFINPEKLPEFGLNSALDKITVGGKKKGLKEPNMNNEDKNQFTIKDGQVILGPERDKDTEGYIPKPSTDTNLPDKEEGVWTSPGDEDDNDTNEDNPLTGGGITNTENLPEDIKDLIDDESDCNAGENKCKDKYPEAFKEYLTNRDLKLENEL